MAIDYNGPNFRFVFCRNIMYKKNAESRTFEKPKTSFVDRLKKVVKQSRSAYEMKGRASKSMAEIHQALQECRVLSGKIDQVIRTDDVFVSKRKISKGSDVRLGEKVSSQNGVSKKISSDGVVLEINPLNEKRVSKRMTSRFFTPATQRNAYSHSLPVLNENTGAPGKKK
jgi:hypothetical protein